MLQCNRCRMMLPDDAQSCTRCGGTVLIPAQAQSQQQANNVNTGSGQQGANNQNNQRRQRPQASRPQSSRPSMNQGTQSQKVTRHNQQNGNIGQQGQARQAPNQNRTMPNRQNANGQRPQSRQNIQYQDDFIGDEFYGSSDVDQFDTETQMQNQQGMQMQNQNPPSQANNKKNKVPSKDGSSLVDWLITMVCLLIPVINIWYIVKSLSKNSNTPDYKKNYIKAFLIYFVVMSVISFAITALCGDYISYWIAENLLTK